MTSEQQLVATILHTFTMFVSITVLVCGIGGSELVTKKNYKPFARNRLLAAPFVESKTLYITSSTFMMIEAQVQNFVTPLKATHTDNTANL